MHQSATVSITLSAELLHHLRRRARSEQVPLNWLVAGLVCDTIVACQERPSRAMALPVPGLGGLRQSPAWN